MYRCDQSPVAAHREPCRRSSPATTRSAAALRQTYSIVSASLIPHTASAHRRLSSRLAQARPQERFFDLIDPLREVHVPPAWPDAGAFLQDALDWFALDWTADQAIALYVGLRVEVGDARPGPPWLSPAYPSGR